MVVVEPEGTAEVEAVADLIAVATGAVAKAARIMGVRQIRASPDIGAPSIRISPPVSGRGAACITAGGARLIFVRNRPPVHGRILLLRNNETGTSPAVKLFKLLTRKKFILNKIKKYKR